ARPDGGAGGEPQGRADGGRRRGGRGAGEKTQTRRRQSQSQSQSETARHDAWLASRPPRLLDPERANRLVASIAMRRSDTRRHALHGIAFFPRGGSAQVVRTLASTLPDHGWDATVVTGSLAGRGDAMRFYAGLDVRPLDF